MSLPESETKTAQSRVVNGHESSGVVALRGEKSGMSDSRKRLLQRVVLIGAPLILVGAIFLYIQASHYESTDDAFIDGHIIPISAKVAGQVLAVHVTDNQLLKQGDVLVEIDPRDYLTQVNEQTAKAAAAEANARSAADDARRYAEIYKNDEISKQQLDNADAAAAAMEATYQKEKAALDQDQLNLSYTKIVAPEDGRVTNKSVEPGAYIQVGQTLFAVVPAQVWVTANFKETQLTHMQPGQHATIRVDAYPGKRFEGHVDSIQSGTGERFSVMPPENATGNYVKVVQRVPVKIMIDTPPGADDHLSPGMSVEPKVKVQ